MTEPSTGDLFHAYLWGQIYGPVIAVGIVIFIFIVAGIASAMKTPPPDEPKDE